MLPPVSVPTLAGFACSTTVVTGLVLTPETTLTSTDPLCSQAAAETTSGPTNDEFGGTFIVVAAMPFSSVICVSGVNDAIRGRTSKRTLTCGTGILFESNTTAVIGTSPPDWLLTLNLPVWTMIVLTSWHGNAVGVAVGPLLPPVGVTCGPETTIPKVTDSPLKGASTAVTVRKKVPPDVPWAEPDTNPLASVLPSLHCGEGSTGLHSSGGASSSNPKPLSTLTVWLMAAPPFAPV